MSDLLEKPDFERAEEQLTDGTKPLRDGEICCPEDGETSSAEQLETWHDEPEAGASAIEVADVSVEGRNVWGLSEARKVGRTVISSLQGLFAFKR